MFWKNVLIYATPAFIIGAAAGFVVGRITVKKTEKEAVRPSAAHAA